MLNTLALVIKGSIVMAYIQILLFIRKNYFAEKHLGQSSIHRQNILKSAFAHQPLSYESKKESLQIKPKSHHSHTGKRKSCVAVRSSPQKYHCLALPNTSH